MALRPPRVLVALDWSGRELRAKIVGRWPREDGSSTEISNSGSRPGETPAYLLAMMEEKRSEERGARSASRSLPLAELASRASAMGMRVNVHDDGQLIDLLATIPR